VIAVRRILPHRMRTRWTGANGCSEVRTAFSHLEGLEAAKDYPEGRWLFIPVKSRKAARELRVLIGLKLPRPRRVRVSG
jgi:hypothetical protein